MAEGSSWTPIAVCADDYANLEFCPPLSFGRREGFMRRSGAVELPTDVNFPKLVLKNKNNALFGARRARLVCVSIVSDSKEEMRK